MCDKTLRVYNTDSQQYYFYLEMHKKQTLSYAREKRDYYSKLVKGKMSIKKALNMLDDFVDPSDPDLDVPNTVHAYQTAERIRKKYPENEEFQIVGLIHDLGKVLFSFGEPNWSVVGDTYVMGCEFPEPIVFYDTMKQSKDYHKYSGNGIYEKGCGMDKWIIAYGHDEYLYWVLTGNKDRHLISEKYMNVIRYHSLYPWHTGGAYREIMNEDGSDKTILEDVLQFNQFDLYSKEDDAEIGDDVKKYYDKLLNKFFKEDLNW
tara:strand:+ start:3800 stop:4582 length:783 start_codon:yes stop_codon:yes gene_type:complete